MYILFSDLCEKEVINCNNGTSMGYISDIEINTDECRTTAIIISENTGLFRKSESYRIPFDKIEKIGKDVIIVNFCSTEIKDKGCPTKKKSIFR